MIYCYNDYLKLTKEYLRNLNYYREAEKNLASALTDINAELGSVSIKSSNATNDEVHGASLGLNSVERAAAYRINLEHRYAEIIVERGLLRKHIDKLTRAISTLPRAEQEVVRLFFIDRLRYTRISETLPGCFAWKEHGGMYGTAGIQDIIACIGGKFYGFEVKTERGKPTALQEVTMRKIQAAGGIAVVVRSVADVKAVLTDGSDGNG